MEPLAYRMKPTKLEDFYGQEEIVGKDKLLYRLIKADKLTSAIFWGPPGCGKTSLARVIASNTKNKFVTLNATTSGVSDIKAVVEASKPAIVKVIIETCLLTDEEKVKACELSVEAGAAFVKTSTGFSTGGATVADVALMKKTVGEKAKVKASGGIRTPEDAKALIEAGADRIGAGNGVVLL